ncbi:MAG: aminoacyl-tRNA hydrolase [Patescibacteria group bacterium]
MATIIIMGLGNPGKKFEKTRHNVGFMVLDKFAKENNFPEFELQKKYDSLISEQPFDSAQAFGSETQARGGDEKIILVKPQTFMNESGRVAKLLIAKNKGKIIVAHDDIDLPVGKIKIVKDRGSAGHKGVESIIKNIGNKNFIRIRLGIGQSYSPNRRTKKAKGIVLKKFAKEENIGEAIKKSVEALNFFIEQGLEKTMNEYN